MDLNRVCSSLERKINEGLGYRPDLSLADARKITSTAAHFMLEYTGNAPSSKDVNEFFLKKFNAKITPCVSTARVYNNHKVVTIVGELLNITRDVKDVNKMKPVIAGQLYIDAPMQDMWEVQSRDGQKVLVRKIKDDIMSIVEARKQAMINSHSHKTFASLKITAAEMGVYFRNIENGDQLKVYFNGRLIDVDAIRLNDDDTVTVNIDSQQVNVSLNSIMEIRKSEKSKEQEQQKMQKYFSDAYGDPGYAESLTRR